MSLTFSRLALALTLSLACSDGTAPTLPCESNPTIAASAGLTPLLSWSPPCRVSLLIVTDNTTQTNVWQIGIPPGTTDLRAPIRSGVKYGEPPPGIDNLAGPVPLVAGHTYSVVFFVHLTSLTSRQLFPGTFVP
jgi:hypothetical protein